jgi:cobalt-zinc-cadmium efflux system protein
MGKLSRSRRLGLAVGANLGLAAGLVCAGVAAHSSGLLADAGHDLADAAGLLLAFAAVRLVQRAPTASRSFGYHRATILTALANAGLIVGLTVLIAIDAGLHLSHPSAVNGTIVALSALVALVVNVATALVLFDHSVDLNMRTAVFHLAGDAAASLGLVVVGVVIGWSGRFQILDPLMALAIAALIAFEGWKLSSEAVAILLESTPPDLNLAGLIGAMAGVVGVEEVHDLHCWSLSSEVRALSAHLVLTGHPSLEEAQIIGDVVRRQLAADFLIAHATLELECERCAESPADPCSIGGDFAHEVPVPGDRAVLSQ